MAAISAYVIFPLLGVNVGVKNCLLHAAKPVTVFNTVMGPKPAPAGTVTVKFVALAAVTCAFVAPKITILPVTVVLKPLPVIVIVVPTAALAGLKEFIIGCAVIFIKPRNEMHNNKYFKIAGIFYLKLVINVH